MIIKIHAEETGIEILARAKEPYKRDYILTYLYHDNQSTRRRDRYRDFARAY